MFAHGVEGNVAQDYRVGALLVKDRVNGVLRVLAHAGEEVAVHPGHPLGSFPQALPGRVLANGRQQVGYDMFNR